ncbi:spidroin-2-like [Muntiacus reevesi]|uniref:spidroin-2-like n=1 Tax=Muntiacus reevesi TaxID=9886 RepID=UPI003306B89A
MPPATQPVRSRTRGAAVPPGLSLLAPRGLLVAARQASAVLSTARGAAHPAARPARVPAPPGPSPQAPAAPSPLPVPRPPLIPGLSTPGTLSAPRQQLAPLGRRRGAGSAARTSVNDPTPRSTPPDPPPAPERVRGGHGCSSSLTEAGRPLERGAEALEGVGVPELTEGAGPEASLGDKDPQAAWGLDAADGEKSKYPVSSVPQIHSSWDLSVGVGGVGGRTEPSWALGVRAGDAAGGPTGASPLPRTRGCGYTPKPSRKLRGSPSLSTVQPAARHDHRTPPAAQMGRGDGPASVGREGIPAQRRQSGPGTPRPASGEGSVEDGASIAPVWAATGHTVQFGKKVGGDTQRPESQEGGTSRGRGGKSGRVRWLRAARWGPATPRPPASGRRGSGQRRLGIAWSWVPRGRAAAAGGARRPGGVRKVSGSPRRLLARGVRSSGPSGRGVGEGSLSGRGPATANFGCDRLGTRERGGEDRRKQRSITKPHWRETRPRRGRSGQGAGTGAARAVRASGDPAHAPTAGRESLIPASPRGGELLALQPREKGPPSRSPAQPPPPPSPSYLLSAVGPGLEAPSQESAARAPRSPERGGGGGGFPSFLQLFLRRPRWLQTALLPLAPCLPLPEPAGQGSACDGERSGAGGSRAAALTASSAGRARGGGGGDSARRAQGRPDRRGSGGSGSGSSGSGAGAVVAAAAAPRL